VLRGDGAFHHVHQHVFAKPIGLSPELSGTKGFALLKASDAEAVPPADLAAFCAECFKASRDLRNDPATLGGTRRDGLIDAIDLMGLNSQESSCSPTFRPVARPAGAQRRWSTHKARGGGSRKVVPPEFLPTGPCRDGRQEYMPRQLLGAP
jgi:hypothetical protein